MPPEAIFDHTTLDLNKVVISQEEIRKANPQRFEMEHLDGILLIDPEKQIIIGYFTMVKLIVVKVNVKISYLSIYTNFNYSFT